MIADFRLTIVVGSRRTLSVPWVHKGECNRHEWGIAPRARVPIRNSHATLLVSWRPAPKLTACGCVPAIVVPLVPGTLPRTPALSRILPTSGPKLSLILLETQGLEALASFIVNFPVFSTTSWLRSFIFCISVCRAPRQCREALGLKRQVAKAPGSSARSGVQSTTVAYHISRPPSTPPRCHPESSGRRKGHAVRRSTFPGQNLSAIILSYSVADSITIDIISY